MAVRYDDDVQPGEPKRAARGQDRGPADVLTGDLGPIPVWGWAVVAVAAVFIYRKFVGPKPSTAVTGTTMPAYPAATNAGVYFLPQSPGPAAPAPTPTPTPTPTPAPAPTPAAPTSWGPRYPAWAPGTVPDRPCEPGYFTAISFAGNQWTCETLDQLNQLAKALPLLRPGGLLPGDMPSSPPGAATGTPSYPGPAAPPPAGNCPPGSLRVVSSGQINGQGDPAGYWNCYSPSQYAALMKFLGG